MNEHLERAAMLAGQIRAVAFAIDEIYTDRNDENFQFLFAAALELIDRLKEALESCSEKMWYSEVPVVIRET